MNNFVNTFFGKYENSIQACINHVIINIYTLLTVMTLQHILYIVYTQTQRRQQVKIIVSNRSGTPIYEQIKEQIKAAIFIGELQEDDILPSIRQLARDLKVSVITTTRAYSDLEQEGFIVNVQGKGCYVLPRNKELAIENAWHKIEEGLSSAITAARADDIAKEEIIQRLDLLWEVGNE